MYEMMRVNKRERIVARSERNLRRAASFFTITPQGFGPRMAHVVTLVASTEILSTAQCEIAIIVIAGVGTRETGLQGKKLVWDSFKWCDS